MLPAATAAHYRAQQRLIVAALALARQVWADMAGDFDAAWERVGLRLAVIAMNAQLGAVRGAEPYLTAILAELGLADEPAGVLAPAAFVGVDGDGRPIDTLLYGAVVKTRTSLAAGLGLASSLATGGRWLDMALQTAVTDTSRAAVSTAITIRPSVGGYVRMLNPPSCARCVVLAGRFYEWNAGFERHPLCDCRHIPAVEHIAGDLTTDPRKAVEAGQVTGLSKADTRAIVDDGADVGQVINARRGMQTAQLYGRTVNVTDEGVTARGRAGQVLAAQGGRYTRTRRLRPESIYRLASDRADAVRLLRRFGYIT